MANFLITHSIISEFGIIFIIINFSIKSSSGSVWNLSSLAVERNNPEVVISLLNSPNAGLPDGIIQKAIASLRIMTLNTFEGGRRVERGLEKIAKHIQYANPDIVGLQEINQTDTDTVVRYLGSDWTHCRLAQTYWLDVAIVTKRSILQTHSPTEGFSNLGCQILISEQPRISVSVWNVHLNYRNYGPYTACILDSQVDNNLSRNVLRENEFNSPDSGITKSRVESVISLLNHPPLLKGRLNTGEEPLLLLGDFNSPSGLDWIYSTKMLHCNRVSDWPVSRILADNGFLDSFRHLHPDAIYKPGITWSPVYYYYGGKDERYLEPQDRIDFIYFKGSRAKPMKSHTYVGSLPIYYIPDNYQNDWPSDHAAVITDFHVEA